MAKQLHRLALLTVAAAIVTTASADASDRRSLWDGATLDGWRQTGPGRFVVDETDAGPALRSEGGMGLLWYSRETFGDARIRVLYRAERADSNGGVFVRIPHPPASPWDAVHGGYEAQIHDAGAADRHTTGALYSIAPARARPSRPGEWNEMIVTLDGDRTTVRINGELVTDFREGDAVPEREEWWEPRRGPRPLRGYLGLQNHGPDDTVWYREISVLPLPPAAAAPGRRRDARPAPP